MTDQEMFNAEDVEFEVLPSKSRKSVVIKLKSESDFNLFKILFSLELLRDKIKDELGILEDAEGNH